MELKLSNDEVRVFERLLRDYLPTLKMEVARTESHEFRHLLIERQELCERLLERLRAVSA